MLASHKGEIPFVVLAIPFLAGIALALALPAAPNQSFVAVSFVALLLVFVMLNVLYSRAGLYRKQWLGGLLAHSAIFLAGMLCCITHNSKNKPNYFEKLPGNEMQAVVNDEPQLKNGFLRFTVQVKARGAPFKPVPVSGSLLVILRAQPGRLTVDYGDLLVLPAKYQTVDPPFNPGEFNYKQYLAHQDIYAQAFLNPSDVVVLKHNIGNRLIGWSLKLRRQLVNVFNACMHSHEAIAVASTLILGYKADLDADVLQAYSRTGTIHVLSVSGAHVAIIFVLLNWLLSFLDRYRYGLIIKAFLTIVLIAYYALLTGLSPAVCRAAVMISFIIIGKTYNRRINTLNISAASAFFLLLLNPFLLADVGFQLSYLAVSGLVVFQPIIYSWLDVENAWLDKLWLACSVSIAAQAITFPLSAYYFHQFPVYFLISNLFIVVPSFIIMYGGVVLLLLAQLTFTPLARALGWLVEHAILFMDEGLQLIEQAPYATVNKIWLTDTEQWLPFIAIVLLFCIFYYKKPVYIKALLSCLLILSVSLSLKRIRSYQSDAITFLSLKKDPAILFDRGGRAVLLTDLPDTAKIYRYSIQPGLDSNRVTGLTTIRFSKDTLMGFWAKQGNMISFTGGTLIIADKLSATWKAPLKTKIRFVYLKDNPYQMLKSWHDNQRQPLWIAAAGSSDRFIATLKGRTNHDGEKMYSLKRNKSLVVQSEQ